jgi:murein DD-endopeptidase MepM/ murein hydrolase activator NlpD
VSGRAGLAIGVIIILGGAIALLTPRFEGEPPRVDAPELLSIGAQGVELTLLIEDLESGLRSAEVRLLHSAGTRTLHEERHPGGFLSGGTPGGRSSTITLTLDPAALGVADGPGTLVISVRDWSLRDGFEGNRTERSIPVVIDTRPPKLSTVSGLTWMKRGGSAAAVYRVGEEVVLHGVAVGDVFFPGHPHPADPQGSMVALFAIPIDAGNDVTVDIVAADRAGNQSRTRFPAKVIERRLPETEIAISDEFLARVAVPLALAHGLDASTPLIAFQNVNRDLRERNEAEIRGHLQGSSAEPLFGERLEQMRGSKVMSRFAEHRTYELRGQKVSEARHYGFDLASTTRAPIMAAAAGVVRFAGDLGIYGECVLLDHGLGLATLYGHLSELSVEAGDAVEAGQRLGASGETGLAGGDHLHFAVLVGGTYVDPMEWWDAKWVRSHVGVRLESATR